MLEWITQNLATIVIGTLLLIAIIFAVLSLVKTKKSGGCNCGCSGCKGCSHSDTCHNKEI